MSLEEKHSPQQKVGQEKVGNLPNTSIVAEKNIGAKQEKTDSKTLNGMNGEKAERQEINNFINQLNLLSEEDKKRLIVIDAVPTIIPTILDVTAEGELEVSKIKKDRIEQKLKKYIEDLIKIAREEIKRIDVDIFVFRNKRNRLDQKQKQKIKYLENLLNGNVIFNNETVQKYLNLKEKKDLSRFYVDKKFFEGKSQEAIKKQVDLNQKLLGIKIPNNHHLHNQAMTIEELITHGQKVVDKINANLNSS